MNKSLLSLFLLLAALMPQSASAYEQVADGVYRDGTTLYITSGVTSLGALQLNPSVIYCYATIPPACVSNTFTAYGATLHVPTAAMVSYFSAQYWYNFTNVQADAVEPQSVTLSQESAELELGHELTLSAAVLPANATPSTVKMLSTDTGVATVSGGKVTAVGVGECYVRAVCVDRQAYCRVTVTPSRVTVTLDKQEARLLPNHLLTLTATCSPATTAELVVTSSNTAVAIPRYVNGTIQVMGIAEGTATITVATDDGWCNPGECLVTVYTELGDVNADGYVTIGDVTTLINYLLSGDASSTNVAKADTNNDGKVSIGDVTTLINYLLSGLWPVVEPEHEWVDLGLPSGTLWATCNVGARVPEEYGDYFAWGEILPKATFSWSNYKWCNGAQNKITKYCTNRTYGTVDNKKELDPEDDAAYMNWGPSWRMPTYAQLIELHNCTRKWTSMNGVNGCLVTGPNGNTLFLPAAGKKDSSFTGAGTSGWCWSRNQDSGTDAFSYEAWCLGYSSTISSVTRGLKNPRYYGWSVRAVRVP